MELPLRVRFDPDEPRDEYGRWTDGGGSDAPGGGGGPAPVKIDSGKVEAKTHANVAAASAKALAAGVKPLPGSLATHPATIASRQVSAKGAKPAYGKPDVASMKLDPARYEHDIGVFKNADFYPNFRAKDLAGSTDQAARAVVDEIKDNLKFLYSFADKSTQVWYDGARALVDDRAKIYGFNDASIAGVYAALSPTKDWDQNVHLGDMLMDVYAKQQDHKWDPAMEAKAKEIWSAANQKVVDLVRDKKLGELKEAREKAVWIRTYNEAHTSREYHVVQPNGALGPIARSKPGKDGAPGKPKNVVWQSLASISNAVNALEANGDRDKISKAMGTAHKVRSFYNNILDPHSANEDVTIDTHAVGAGLLRAISNTSVPVMHNFGLSPGSEDKQPGWEAVGSSVKTGLSGLYPVYADAYREAAKELGIQPRQLQSAVWVVKREAFGKLTDKQKNAVEGLWQKYHDDPNVTLQATQQAIVDIAGLSHERRSYPAAERRRRAGHAAELHRHELGQAAAGVDRGAGKRIAERAAGLELVRAAQRRAFAQSVARFYERLWATKFDPDQPRDEDGKWSDGGGSSSSGGGGESHAAKLSRIVGSVKGAKEAIEAAKAKLANGVSTKPASGEYSPQRQEIHREILGDIFTPDRIKAATPAAGEQPTLHLLGGAGGSGKSWFIRTGHVPKSAVYLNADDVKAALPEYQGWNAALLHEESSDVLQTAEQAARANKLDVVLDGTMGSLSSLEKRIDDYKAAGYRIVGHFMRVTKETSAKRALERFVRGGETGRYVPPEMLLVHDAAGNFEKVRDRLDDHEMYDNEGDAPKLVARK